MNPSEPDKPKAFLAYGSESPARSETLESAAEGIGASGVTEVLSWRGLNAGGTLLVSSICEAIHKCSIFIADVSTLNNNVLFELGFAIALKKRIWLLLDESVPQCRNDFDRYQLLSTVGYCGYTNSTGVIKKLGR